MGESGTDAQKRGATVALTQETKWKMAMPVTFNTQNRRGIKSQKESQKGRKSGMIWQWVTHKNLNRKFFFFSVCSKVFSLSLSPSSSSSFSFHPFHSPTQKVSFPFLSLSFSFS
jgi:hypothetical protein